MTSDKDSNALVFDISKDRFHNHLAPSIDFFPLIGSRPSEIICIRLSIWVIQHLGMLLSIEVNQKHYTAPMENIVKEKLSQPAPELENLLRNAIEGDLRLMN